MKFVCVVVLPGQRKYMYKSKALLVHLIDGLMLSFASQVICLLHYESCGVGRLRGGVEIYGAGKQMVDVVMATLAAQIEW